MAQKEKNQFCSQETFVIFFPSMHNWKVGEGMFSHSYCSIRLTCDQTISMTFTVMHDCWVNSFHRDCGGTFTFMSGSKFLY